MRKILTFFRLIATGLVLARHDALVPPEFRGLLPFGTRLIGWLARFGLPLKEKNRGKRLARALEKLGPSYVKLGQFLATRNDILSEEVVSGLASLKDKMQPFSQQQAEAILLENYGENWQQIFPSFGPSVAAASVAQVHQAKTADGKTVAVKLLRPGIETRINRDVQTLQMGARLVQNWFVASRRLEPVRFVETVTRSLLLELDLRMEAAAASELAEVSTDIQQVVIPNMHWPLVRERVLVMDWLEATPLTDMDKLRRSKIDMNQLAELIPTSFLSFALDHGVFHADLHEGNMFAFADGRLGLVDFGIVGRIGPAQRRYLAEILYGFLRQDYRRVAEVHFEAGYVPDTHLVDDFAQALRAVGEPVFGKTAKDVSMGQLLLHLFAVTSRFDMHLRPELVLLQKTMVQVEGVARTLNPDHDLWAASAPIIERYIKRELGPEGIINDMTDDFLDLRDAVRALPAAINDLTALAKTTKAHGFSLDDDSLKRLSNWQAKANRIRDFGLLAGGSGLLLTAIKFVFFNG
ncbi:Ubiquinone biosynthesis regulatory protein kinase UbiB [hydrothermal vent metagenome]|uniref:Ubiquinone biosynthesis regulatory protein kinase UbiB n=1 Tax=hydrothermal vent metagenome TaxID=652676 RepID=A0A3B0SSD2_9ZZZZ